VAERPQPRRRRIARPPPARLERGGPDGRRSAHTDARGQGIASGLLGPEAFRGGAFTAALGLALHFVIAFAVAAVYYAASRSWPVLVRHAVPCGMAYGVLVHLVMDTVVLPLSRGTFRRPPWPVAVAMVAIHMLFVGLPAALAVRRHAPAAGTPPRVDEPAAARTR
jgi:hypothetical protein